MNDTTLTQSFQRWYVAPLEKLKELPGGDGGFVAFMIGLAFYERLLKARLRKDGKNPDNSNLFKNLMADDLGISVEEANNFWELFRHGILHQGMPKVTPRKGIGWYFTESFSDKPVLMTIEGESAFCINPWKFTQRIIDQFLTEPDLLNQSLENPFGVVF